MQPLTRSDDGRDLRAVDDEHVALSLEMIGDVLAGELAGLDVVGHHRHVGAGRCHVEGRHDHAGGLGALHGQARWPSGRPH